MNSAGGAAFVSASTSPGGAGTPATIFDYTANAHLRVVAGTTVFTTAGPGTVVQSFSVTQVLNMQSPSISITGLTGAWTANGTAAALGANALTGSVSGITFTSSGVGVSVFPFLSITSLDTTISCFLGGTNIRTPDGNVCVENLAR